ncbi:Sir2 family protein [Micromonospora sp. Llam0]|uniref:SIR2 family NAD-dependent protein deacylase n=1 Tax=Micromonospora sp. Llam0 TaxID=2485143 RepID=UPI000F484A30|nr:Sir2 family NAD-dependent protein deacetylase [Micromonospora sp. Llam0]ROO60974.1 Sir2 family protein [Micromonospora sp. Llam0]
MWHLSTRWRSGPNGVWTRDPQAAKLFTLDAYVADPAVRRRSWLGRRDHPAWSAQPNEGHASLVELERSGRLAAIVTQNIDGLHQRAGNSPDKVIEIHGTMSEVECLSCDDRTGMDEALARVAAGEDDPDCRLCGGILKAATPYDPIADAVLREPIGTVLPALVHQLI